MILSDTPRTLPAIIAARAASEPNRPLIQHVDGTTVSYGELHHRNLRFAGAYAALGVGEGDMVATMMPNGIETYSAWLGLSWLRAVEVPLNVAYQGPMLSYTINYSRASLLVISAEYLERLRPIASELEHLRTVVVLDSDDVEAALPFRLVTRSEFLKPAPAGELAPPELWDTVALIFTSGTTGRSKGVLVPWGQMFYNVRPDPTLLNETGAYYSTWPTFHMSGKYALYQPARIGARLALRPQFSASAYWEDVRRFGCTSAMILPPMLKFLLLQPELPDDRDNPLVGFNHGPVVPEVWEFCERFGTRFRSGFGMTEIGGPLQTGWMPKNPKSSGRPVEGPPYYDIKVVDSHDDELPPGEIGELVVRSRLPWAIMSGYFGLPEATAAAWRNGWFHTGDGFIKDEAGEFFFVDRMKDYIRRRGENISSFEVEAYVAAHPAVLEVAAFGIPSEYGEDEVKVCVIRRPGNEALTPADLHAQLASIMPSFMLPRFIEFVEALPRTDATGRVKKVELKPDARNDRTWDREADTVRVK